MRNIIRTALVIGTLATPMIAMAQTPKKDAPAATDAKKDAPKTDAKDASKTDAKDAPKTDAKDTKAKSKKDAKKDVKEPAAK